jgi:hypothetical protein
MENSIYFWDFVEKQWRLETKDMSFFDEKIHNANKK